MTKRKPHYRAVIINGVIFWLSGYLTAHKTRPNHEVKKDSMVMMNSQSLGGNYADSKRLDKFI